MSTPTQTPVPQTPARPATEAVRQGLGQLFGAERRLRGRAQAVPGELSYGQVRALAALGREHEMTAGQLARSADLNPASVTALLDHLEESGVVARRRSTEDRRVCHVALTPAGEALLAKKLAGWQAHWEEHLRGFDERELETAARVIHALTELYDSIPGTPSEPPAAPDRTAGASS